MMTEVSVARPKARGCQAKGQARPKARRQAEGQARGWQAEGQAKQWLSKVQLGIKVGGKLGIHTCLIPPSVIMNLSFLGLTHF